MYAATTAVNSVMHSKKTSVPPVISTDVSKLSNNHNFEFANASLMSTGGKQRVGRNQYNSNANTQQFNRSMLMTPDSTSRVQRTNNHFGINDFEKKRGSVNIKDMKIQLNNAREKMKSQGQSRGTRNIMKSPDHQGGFHSGFFEA